MALKKREFTPESGTVDTYAKIKMNHWTLQVFIHLNPMDSCNASRAVRDAGSVFCFNPGLKMMSMLR